MTAAQKRVFWLVLAFCLVYFVVFIFPNAVGAKSEAMLAKTSVDEPVNYQYVVRMLTPAKDLKDLFSRWVLYGDYHYGYPFYFWSAVVILPVRLAEGGQFTNFPQTNLLLMRQLISVLPMLAAVVLLVYLFTGFRSAKQSLALLVILLSLRALVRGNIQWWHPDALSILAVVLTIYFLRKDELKFKRNFYYAAAACGVAAGIKLAGFFFVLTIPAYLLYGWLKKYISVKRMLLAGSLFLVVMGAALVVSNPFLYNSGARQELIHIQLYKTTELDNGYAHDNPYYYQKGPQYWEWTLSTWYESPAFLAFALLSLLVGCVWGPDKLLNRLVLTWIIPMSIYLLWFVAVKPDHYWLPVMLPLFASLLNIPLALKNNLIPWFKEHARLSRVATVLIVLLLAGQVTYNVVRPYSGNVAQYVQGLTIEQTIQK